VITEFNALASKYVAAANTALTGKKLQPIHIVTPEEWQKKRAGQGGSAPQLTMQERD